MSNETEFVVRRRGALDQTFLDYYRKICNYNVCVFLMEERFGDEIMRYVLPKRFCKEFDLIEVTLKP